jgi:hypothetical protein
VYGNEPKLVFFNFPFSDIAAETRRTRNNQVTAILFPEKFPESTVFSRLPEEISERFCHHPFFLAIMDEDFWELCGGLE